MALILSIPSGFTPSVKAQTTGLTMPVASELLANDRILYLVNCGSTEVTTVPTGYKLGLYQSGVVDQEFAQDSVTNASWGYRQEAPYIMYSKRTSAAATDIAECLAYNAKGTGTTEYTYKKGTSGIYYNFEVPDGSYEYDVTVGVKNPWDARTMDVVLEDVTVKESLAVKKGTLVEETYSVTVTDGELNVKLHNPKRTSTANDAMVSYIIVRAKVSQLDTLKQLITDVTLTDMEREEYSEVSLQKFDEALTYAKKVAYADDANTYTDEKILSYKEKLNYRYNNLKAKNTPVTYQSFSGTDAYDKYTDFAEYNGTTVSEWYDTSGNKIEAHGGIVTEFTVDGVTKYYWYGEDRTDEKRGKDTGVRVYSSTDLYNWTDEGLAFRNMTDIYDFEEDYFNDLYSTVTEGTGNVLDEEGMRYGVERNGMSDNEFRDAIKKVIAFQIWDDKPLERPKVIYNDTTGKYVMWYHSDGPTESSTSNYSAACAAVAVSDTPNGPFKYLGRSRLNYVPGAYSGEQGMARDMTLYKDDDGTAYIIYASEQNKTLFISKLSEDYLSLSAKPVDAVQGIDYVRDACFVNKTREAPSIFKFNNKYYMLTSSTDGWASTQTRYAVAENMMGPWTDMGDACETIAGITPYAANKTFGGQSTGIFAVDESKGEFVYMTDRWNRSTPTSNGDVYENPSYVWFPIEVNPETGKLVIRPYVNWKIEDMNNLGMISSEGLFSYIGEAIQQNIPVLITNTAGTQQKNSEVAWSSQVDTSLPGGYTITGKLMDIGIGTYKRQVTTDFVIGVEKAIYVVDIGGTSATVGDDYKKLVEGSNVKVRNYGIPDQTYNPDTTASWGYVDDGGATARASSGSIYNNLRYANSLADTITYKFDDIEEGEYNIYVGYYDPWSKYTTSRKVDVSINDNIVASERKITGENTTDKYGLTMPEDGTVTLTFAASSTSEKEVIVNWIIIEKVSEDQLPTLESIQITENPVKTEYLVSEELDLSGLVVTAMYSDATTKEINLDEITVTGYDKNHIGSQEVEIAYEDKTTSFSVTVKEQDTSVGIQYIEIKNSPTKVEYATGEAIVDLSGMVVTVYYDNETTEDIVSISEFTASGLDPSILGTQTITIDYKGYTATYTITVVENNSGSNRPIIEAIVIKSEPNKTTYTVGESLNIEGLVIDAIYDDGSKEEVINSYLLQIEGYDAQSEGTQNIIVSYLGKSAYFMVTVTKKTIPDTTYPDSSYNTVIEQADDSETIIANNLTLYQSVAIPTRVTTKVKDNVAIVNVNIEYGDIAALIEKNQSSKPISLAVPVAATNTLVDKLLSDDVSTATASIIIDNQFLQNNAKVIISEICVEKELIQALRTTEKTLKIQIKDKQGTVWYSWEINGKQLLDSGYVANNVNLAVQLHESTYNYKLNELVDGTNNQGHILELADNLAVPDGSTLKINMKQQLGYQSGSSVYIYRYNKELNVLDSIAKVKYSVDVEGYISVNLKHGDTYVIVDYKADSSVKRTLLQQIQSDTKLTIAKGKSVSIGVELADVIVAVPSFSDSQKRRYGNETMLVTVSYSSSSLAVATVSKDGIIKAKRAGTVIITTKVTLQNGQTKTSKTKVIVK